MHRLASTALQTIAWEWHVFCATPGVQTCGDATLGYEQAPDAFVASSPEAEGHRIQGQYPGLTAVWARQVDNWRQFVKTFMRDARSFVDREMSSDKIRIDNIVPDLSDLHNHNRAVIRVKFSDGATWFYKCRSGKCEIAWFRLLDWLNAEGFSASFATVDVRTGDQDHSWMTEVVARPCKNPQEATLYFFRAGALLYLIHCLRGVDFHAGNVVDMGAHPVIVDCETLLHPSTPLPSAFRDENNSVFRTGMLPLPGARRDGSFSPLVRQRDLLLPPNVEMKSTQCVTSIVSGFNNMHLFMGDKRRVAEFRRHAAAFRCAGTRLIYRPTLWYQRLLHQSYAPALLKSSTARGAFLWDMCGRGSIPKSYRTSEVRALERSDIPIFSRMSTVAPRTVSDEEARIAVTTIRSALAVNSRRI